MAYNEMDDIHLYWNHCTDVKELKINGENISSIGDINNNIIYVAKNGSDTHGNGSLGNPFLTIEYACIYARNLLVPANYPERIVIKVAPGIYEEHLTQSYFRINIVGNINTNESRNQDVVIRNTGADPDHYPIGSNNRLNLIGITILTSDADNTPLDGIIGVVSNGSFYNCSFEYGHFIEQDIADSRNCYMVFHNCNLSGDIFELTGIVDNKRFIECVDCFISAGTSNLSSTGTAVTRQIKLERCLLGNNLNIFGDWSILCPWSEFYSGSKLTFDTDGYVDIFSSILYNGIHFYSDTPETKKLVNCIFKNTPTGEGDVTADVNVEFIEYSGNHQHNGIDGEIITVSKIKNVGGGQNTYRNIHEALKGSILQDTIINLEGDVEIDSPLLINPNIDVQIDGNKKWKLATTHATTLCELGANQHLSFVNMKQITGGKKLIVNGNNAQLSLVSCGRYTEPNYTNIEITAGNIESFVYLVKTTLIGTGAQPISVDNINPWLVIDRSFIKGSSGEPAIEWSVDADSRFRCKYTTLIHGSGSTNAPLIYTPATGRVDIAIYNSAMNAAFDSSDFHNVIGNPSITIDPQIDY